MSKSQRTKGAAFEREVVNIIKEALGEQVKRNLDQWRDGGHDIALGPYLIECKRRASIAVYEWLDQCTDACKGQKTPLVVARGDRREAVVIMRLTDFLPLLKDKGEKE
jgi:hypothetical protein